MKIVKAPNEFREDNTQERTLKVFLAGSIEMGAAENWQDKVTNFLQEFETFRQGKTEIKILNPRRDDWDSSWVQSIENKQFREQVEWELNGLDEADVIVLWFDPKTKSPISLLELGLHASTSKMVVYCPEGFWRKGNVDIVCERNGVPYCETEADFFDFLKEYVEMKI